MSEVITVIEHKSVPIVRSPVGGQNELGEKHAALLEKLEKKLPAKAWSWENRKIKFASYCGVISLGDLSIEILPKIHDIEADDVESSRKALVHMLYRARHLKLSRAGTAGINLQKRFLLDIFILHFCEQLHAQLTRGMIQKYVRRKENLNVLRGKLKIGEHLKRNLAHGERLFCQYDELSADNIYNQVLKHVLGIMLKKAKGNRALQHVSELLARFEPVSDFPADAATAVDSLGFNRLTERYEEIFNQCGFFLRGLYPDVTTGKEDCLALLFDMNRLFEAYVGAELRKDKETREKNMSLREQRPQKYFATREDSDKSVFMMRPDFSFLNKSGDPVVIADAKWKILDSAEQKLGIAQSDMYQIGSYASRYGVRNLVLFYPMQEKLTEPIKLTLLKEHEAVPTTLRVLPIDISGKRQNEFSLWNENREPSLQGRA
ncbi:MAG: restriction endonuclease [Candidatus Dadabacteria bacterium]|nr:restriction endonuclease [Candidatus Dadabacteria bacterium]